MSGEGKVVFQVARPAGWGPVRWLVVRGVDRVFHAAAYGRVRVPGLWRAERRGLLRGWCDAVTGISPAARQQVQTMLEQVQRDRRRDGAGGGQGRPEG